MKHQIRWTVEKIQQRLQLIEPLIYRQRHTLPPFRFYPLNSPLDAAPLSNDADVSGWQTLAPYDYWAHPRTNFVLRTTIQTPQDWSAAQEIALYLPLGEPGSFSHPEALLYIDEQPLAATDRHHQEVLLPAHYADGQVHHLVLHGWSGNSNQQGEQARLFMRPCELVQIDGPTRDFHSLARTALGVAKRLDSESVVRGKLLDALDRAFVALDTRDPLGDVFYASLPVAMAILRTKIAEAGAPMDVSIAAVGHAHIDVAWLWTLAQTRRKAERTFYTVLHLMQQFPNYKFTQSQPQLYDYVRQDQPALFEAIQQRVAEQRWEPIGGMWVEADCNLTGSEALVRQFVLGRHFFRQHFGEQAESPVLWLPDVFGYAWALPQIIKKSGLDYFMTIKIAWNQYNRFPYDSFWWQGLDGTQVLTHFSPTPENGVETRSTYNAQARPQDALDSWSYFLQREEQSDLLMSFGYGDGGGGPTRDMLETIRDLEHFPGAPQVRHERVIDFFRKLDAEVGPALPTWNGELYLEYHRGTYTTQAKNKLGNRRSETLLHDAEFLCVLASVIDPAFDYPKGTINKAWELTCLNQFHDILPGSSIHEVYEDSSRDYAHIARLATQASSSALAVIVARIAGDMVLLNPTSFSRADIVAWDGALSDQQILTTADGVPVPTQRSGQQTLLQPPTLAPYSATPLRIVTGDPTPSENTLRATPDALENAFVRVELNADGDIRRIYDKRQGREVLAAGALANQFQAFEDRPMFWDAWDIDIFYDDKHWLSEPASKIDVIEQGPLRATIQIERKILNSPYVQRISLRVNSPEIRIETEIDWQERHILLKTAFPVDILSPTATYDIQWGNVERPTHRNTSWDWARFETCAHKWVDLSEADYGVSLLNDCKYGHDIHDNVMRLSLLKGSTYPDPTADLGTHTFTYSLLPHAGDWRTTTIPAAYALNDPLILRTVATTEPKATAAHISTAAALFSVDADHVVLETVKRAENGDGVILRLYEAHRKRGNITITVGFDLAQVVATNLIEDDLEPVSFAGRQITVSIKPYEILTLRVIPERNKQA